MNPRGKRCCVAYRRGQRQRLIEWNVEKLLEPEIRNVAIAPTLAGIPFQAVPEN